MADTPSAPAPSTSTPAPTDSSTTTAPLQRQTATTMADTNGGPNTPSFDLSSAAATQVRPGGAPARVFLNEKIVPYLLEGMKTVTRDQPANPLQVLGEFLIQKSKEVEGDAKKEAE